MYDLNLTLTNNSGKHQCLDKNRMIMERQIGHG